MTAHIPLNVINFVPTSLLSAEPQALRALLGAPTLIHLAGRRPQPLFVSVLLHGNEDTGWQAIRSLLNKYQGQALPRGLSIFIGNITAAAEGLRRLDGQPDYNRVWPGGGGDDCPERALMARVFDEMRRRQPFASIDIHNNTGLNPHYACTNRLDTASLHLATLFSRTVIYFLRPLGVQSLAFSELCPSVTIECGQVGHAGNTEHAVEFIDSVLHLAEFPRHRVPEHDIDLYHTVATVRVRDDVSFGTEPSSHALTLQADLDHFNFRDLAPGTVLGTQHDVSHPLLTATDENGKDVTARYFAVCDGALQLITHATPSMLTQDQRVIRQDCLCYLMERLTYGVEG